MEDACHPVTVTVDGQDETIRVHGGADFTDEDRAALGALVGAARRLMDKDHYGGVRIDLALARTHAGAALPDGRAKQRLRTAVRGALSALEEADEIRRALAELVRLKDGPRDAAYRAAKDAAWEHARHLLNREAS